MPNAPSTSDAAKPAPGLDVDGQIVLVMQGGGALGSYQAGVYEAFHEAGLEPDWVVGTSIGAINGAIIAGNKFEDRLERLREFWQRLQKQTSAIPAAWLGHHGASLNALTSGVSGMFSPNPALIWGIGANVGVERASFYSTEDLKATLHDLVDFTRLDKDGATRFTVGAVSARTGQMHYFDSRHMAITPQEVMASSALPPAFPAVRIGDELYWDGGVYSNTPIEVVFDDNPRRNSIVFAAQLWRAAGPEPASIRQVLDRYKDIQFASRHKSHVARQEQIHHLRHVVRQLIKRLPESEQSSPEIRKLAGYGCGTVIHIMQMDAPRMNEGDLLKEMDFTAEGIYSRWAAGLAHARRTLAQRAWEKDVDPDMGVFVHDDCD